MERWEVGKEAARYKGIEDRNRFYLLVRQRARSVMMVVRLFASVGNIDFRHVPGIRRPKIAYSVIASKT